MKTTQIKGRKCPPKPKAIEACTRSELEAMAIKLTGQMPPRKKTTTGISKCRANKAQLVEYILAAMASKVVAEASRTARSQKGKENIERGFAKLGLTLPATLTKLVTSRKGTVCVQFASASTPGAINYASEDGLNCTCKGHQFNGCWHTKVAPLIVKWLRALGLAEEDTTHYADAEAQEKHFEALYHAHYAYEEAREMAYEEAREEYEMGLRYGDVWNY